jgi:hypothetical protein
VSSWYQPSRSSRNPTSCSSSAATWTSCERPRQLAIHPRPHSFRRTSRTRPTSSCDRTAHAAPWKQHTVAHTN